MYHMRYFDPYDALSLSLFRWCLIIPGRGKKSRDIRDIRDICSSIQALLLIYCESLDDVVDCRITHPVYQNSDNLSVSVMQ